MIRSFVLASMLFATTGTMAQSHFEFSKDSTGTYVVVVDAAEDSIAFVAIPDVMPVDTATGKYVFPLTVLANLRDQVQASASADKEHALAWILPPMGSYSSVAVGSIPGNLAGLVAALTSEGASWCGSSVIGKQCEGSCTSSCGSNPTNPQRCCNCVCFGCTPPGC
jgi:hypothetical protein